MRVQDKIRREKQESKDALREAWGIMRILFILGLSVVIIGGVIRPLSLCPKEVMNDFQTKPWTFWIPLFSLPFVASIFGGIVSIIIHKPDKKQ